MGSLDKRPHIPPHGLPKIAQHVIDPLSQKYIIYNNEKKICD